MRKEAMITRTVKKVTVKGKKLVRFEGTTPIFDDIPFILKNPRNTEEGTLRINITRNYGAEANRSLIAIEAVDVHSETYALPESKFFELATLVEEA